MARALLALASLCGALVAGCGEDAPAPAKPKTILVTGFGPFGGVEANPSWDAIKDLDGARIGGSVIRVARIDVVYAKAPDQIEAAIERTRPDAVLSLGVAPDDELRIETTARNEDTAKAPDNEGEVRAGRTIDEGGPATIPTRLPVQGLVDALRKDGYAVRTSDDAGGYLCNHLFYALMERFPERRSGFVHVPALGRSWDLERLKRAVRRMLEVIDAEVSAAAR
jgi:pyroglutamyl-peptidase